MSNDGLILENMDLSHIHLAVPQVISKIQIYGNPIFANFELKHFCWPSLGYFEFITEFFQNAFSKPFQH